MSALQDAIDGWDAERERYEDALREGSDALEEAREALYEAELALEAAFEASLQALQTETEARAAALRAGIDARVRVEEQRALEAERTAKHGELAGAGHTERERIGQLDLAAEALDAVRDAVSEFMLACVLP